MTNRRGRATVEVRLGRRAVYTGTASKSGFRIARARIRTRR
jgi:hypothetical protein